MSESKKKKRRPALQLPHLENENLICFFVFLGVVFSVLTRCVVVHRTGVQGSAYFFAAYEVLVFFMLFFPVGVSGTIREQFGQRFESGFYRNAKRIFNAAVVALFFYIVVVAVLWWQLSEGASEFLLLGKTNSLPLMWLLPVFVVDVLTLLFRGFLDGESEASAGNVVLASSASGVVFLIRQAATFIFVLIFAGVFHEDGSNVSRLFRNEEVKYVYGAAGVAIGFLLGAIVGLVFYLLIYFKRLRVLQRQVDRDPNRRRENSNGILFTYASTASCAYMGMYGIIFLAQIFAMHHYRAEGELIQSYQWGIFEGICMTAITFPLLLIFFMHLRDAKQITRAIRLGDNHEVRIKCQSLTDVSMTMTFFLSAFSFAATKCITKGIYGIDSVMAVRMLRCSSVTVLFLAYAFITSLQLLFMQQKTRVAMHSFGAMIVGAGCLWALIPEKRLGIYAIFIALVVFSVVLSALNLLIMNRKIRFRMDFIKHFVWPLICSLVAGALAYLLQLLFGLFLPAILASILIFLISFLVYFVVSCKTGLITEYTFYGIPLGEKLERFGRILKVL